jgi:uracil-DNA glycosylase family 4
MEGVGPSKASIMLVGDCPSFTDDKTGEPFSGDGGSKLNYLLEKAGINRDDVYLTFAVKCKAFKPSDIGKKHVVACQSHIAKEILEVRPKIIVCMGKAPLMQLMNENTIGDFQGHIDDFDIDYKYKKKERTFSTKIIPTYSPVSALTKWEFDDYIINDLKKAKKFAKTGDDGRTKDPEFKLVLSKKDLREFEEYYSNVERFNTDYETTGLKFYKHKIINAGYADNGKFATIVPMLEYEDIHMNHKLWTDEDRKLAKKINKFVKANKKRIFATVGRVNASKAKKTLHNGKFDQKFGRKNKIPYKNFDFDTIIGDALIDENKKHDLNTCMKLRGINYGAYDTLLWPYTNKSHKNKKSYQFIPPLMICKYLAIDVCGNNRLEKKIRKELKKEKLEKLFFDRQMPLTQLMTDCEYRGMKFGVERLKEIGRLFDAKIIDIESKVRKATKIKDLNLNSPDQLLAYFESKDYPFEEMGIKRGKKGYSVGADTLEKFARKRKYAKIPKLILLHRSLSTMKKTFLDGKDGESGLLQSVDDKGFIHGSWNIHTPRTGRMSSSEPNLQNIPRPNPLFPDANIRQLFKTKKKNWILFSADFAQLELRVGAFLSKDKTMIKEIQQGVDLHTRNVVKFGTTLGFLDKDMTEEKFAKIRSYKPPKNWEEKYRKNKKKLKSIENKILLSSIFDEHRVFAKTLGFGLNYGMDANTLAQQFSMDVEDVQDMIDIYFEKYHYLHDWREEICDQSIDVGLFELPETGRKRRFTAASEWFNSEHSQDCKKRDFDIGAIHRQAMNFPIQGYANEIYVEGKLKLEKELRKRKLKSRILLSIHDGLVGEGPKSEMKIVKELCHQTMERVLGEGKWKVPLVVDFDLYDCWYGEKFSIEELAKKAK